MRQIVLDTETTGLDPRSGHRIIEVACIELVNRRLTGHHLHKYINPEREIDAGAQAVHGITLEFLADKPKFADIADEFLEFINGAELIIHNAPFDIGFLNAELDRLGRVPVGTICNGVIDTLRMAKEIFPGKRNSLDALCERYEIDNSSRTLHGALLDTELLADVYLAMTRGQNTLMIEPDEGPRPQLGADGKVRQRKPLTVRRATEEELAEHARALAAIDKESKGACLWLALEKAQAEENSPVETGA
jgi:DNA polymerase-3 subunit epsilon